MANIKPAEISAIIKNQLTGSKVGPSLDEVGTVLQVGDGIARIYVQNMERETLSAMCLSSK